MSARNEQGAHQGHRDKIEPWRDIAIDLSGPWKAMVNGKERFFHTLTIIDVFTGWPEIIPIGTKTKQLIADLVEQEWFRRCPRPSRVNFDQGGEFDNHVFRGVYQVVHSSCTHYS